MIKREIKTKTRLEEYDFIFNILLDLKSHYPEHNPEALQTVFDVVKYKLEREVAQLKTAPDHNQDI